MNSNTFFENMCKEAENELASGSKGTWREIPTNTLFLACFGMLSTLLTDRLSKPLWFFASSVCALAIGWLIKQFI